MIFLLCQTVLNTLHTSIYKFNSGTKTKTVQLSKTLTYKSIKPTYVTL